MQYTASLIITVSVLIFNFSLLSGSSVDSIPPQTDGFGMGMLDSTIDIDEIQVRASRIGESGPMTYSNLRAEDIQNRNYGQDVPFLLNHLPSVTVTSDAGTGIGYTGIRIRGVDPTRINVSLNGVPLNDSESQGVFWVNMPDLLSSVDDIQIQRGVGTSAMGSNAFGGVININTNRVDPEFRLITDFSAGSFNTRRASANFSSGLSENGVFAEGRISRIKSDGFVDRATADLTSAFFAVGRVGERSSLRLNLLHGEEVTYQAWNGIPKSFLDDEDLRKFNSAGMNRPGSPHPNEVDDYQQTHIHLYYNYQHSANWESGLTLHYTHGKGFFEQYRSNDRYSSYGIEPVEIGGETITRTDLIRRRWLDNDFYGLIFNTVYQPTFNTTFQLGGGWNHYSGAHFGEVIWARIAPGIENDFRYYDNDADKYDFNVFVKGEYRWNDFLFWGDLQYRMVDYQYIGFNRDLEFVDQDDRLNFFNPKAGLSYFLSSNSNIYASVAVSNREPNRRDYTESSPESRPKPEQMVNLETGFRHRAEQIAFEVNFYYMRYRDQLVPTGRINDVGAVVRENVDNSYRLGIEAGANWQVFEWANIFANTTLSRNIIVDYLFFIDDWDTGGQVEKVFENTTMALSPSVIANYGIALNALRWSGGNQNGGFDIDLRGQYVSRQYLDNTERKFNSLDPYNFLDLNFSLFLNRQNWPGLSLNFAIRNLTDNWYETNGWSYTYRFEDKLLTDQGYFPQAGRNFLVGLRLEW